MAPRSRPAREVRLSAERAARPHSVQDRRPVRHPRRCSPRSMPPHPGAAIAGKGLLRRCAGCPRPRGAGPVPGEAAGVARSDWRPGPGGLSWFPAWGILPHGAGAWRSRSGSPFRPWSLPSRARFRAATALARHRSGDRNAPSPFACCWGPARSESPPPAGLVGRISGSWFSGNQNLHAKGSPDGTPDRLPRRQIPVRLSLRRCGACARQNSGVACDACASRVLRARRLQSRMSRPCLVSGGRRRT